MGYGLRCPSCVDGRRELKRARRGGEGEGAGMGSSDYLTTTALIAVRAAEADRRGGKVAWFRSRRFSIARPRWDSEGEVDEGFGILRTIVVRDCSVPCRTVTLTE